MSCESDFRTLYAKAGHEQYDGKAGLEGMDGKTEYEDPGVDPRTWNCVAPHGVAYLMTFSRSIRSRAESSKLSGKKCCSLCRDSSKKLSWLVVLMTDCRTSRRSEGSIVDRLRNSYTRV